jgi:two-component system sensor histidine kinase EvgS
MNMDKQGVPVQTRTIERLLCTLLVLACVFAPAASGTEKLPFNLSPPFVAQSALPLDSHDRQWLDERGVVRVAIATADYEPIDITSDRNRYQGLSADYLSLVGAKLGVTLQITGFARPEDMVEALLEGSVDVLASANRYDRGIGGLAFTREYLPDRAVVVVRENDHSLSAGLVGKRVIIQDGYADIAAVERIYPKSQVILAPTLYSAMEALEHGEADAVIVNEVVARAYISMRRYLGLQIRFDSLLPAAGFAFAMREQDAKLLGLFNRSLDDLNESVAREILHRWTSGLGVDAGRQRIRLSPDEQAWVRRHPQVLVASTLHPPYIYKDEHGQWVGLNIDVLNRISRMTGLMFVHEAMPSTQAAIEVLRAGSADMNTTLAESSERRKFLDFTYAYGGHSWVYVIRDDRESPVTLTELSGKVLAMPTGHALLEFIRTSAPGIKLRLVPTYQEARALVEAGEADATIQNEAGAVMASRGRLKVGRGVEGRWSPDRLAVVKEQPELLSILNKALAEFPVAELRAIRMKWLGGVMPQEPLLHRIPGWVYWLLAMTTLSVAVSLFWRHRIRCQIHQRMHAQRQLNDQLVFQRALFDGIPQPLYVRDLTGRLVACNASYEQALGISFEQMNGRRLIDVDLIPKAVALAMHEEHMGLLQSREPVLVDRCLDLPGRRLETRQWSAPFYLADGQLQGLVGGWTELTERKGARPVSSA